MKKITFAFLLFVSSQFLAAQSINYWVLLTDKKNSPYSINKPLEFLSERSVERRIRQHIPVRERDLPVNPSYVNTIKSSGVSIHGKSKWFNAILITTDDVEKIKKIRSLSFVKEVRKMPVGNSVKPSSKFNEEMEPVSVLPTSTQKTLSGLNYGLSYDQAHMIGADCMHNMGFMGQGMVIAQLDAGFFKVDSLPAFDTLRSNGQILGTWDFVANNASVYEDFPHGMNVLSCMGGNLPGRIVGTAPKAKFWLLRTEDAFNEGLIEEVYWEQGAEFADSVGADVINSSLGYSLFDNTADNHTYADMDGNTTICTNAADWAASVGIFVTSSAGNSAGPPWFKITAPADADSILTVGAVDTMLNVASFSSRGPTFDGRVKPNTAAKGVQSIVAAPGGDVYAASGTSFSSPITAGAVACLWQAHPTKTNMEVLAAIEQSASQFATPDSLIGYGIPNFCIANTLLTGIEENTSFEPITVFPNPFSNSLSISFYSETKQNVTVELYDVTGRKVGSDEFVANAGTSNVFSLRIRTGMSTGVYFLKLTGENMEYYVKVVKE